MHLKIKSLKLIMDQSQFETRAVNGVHHLAYVDCWGIKGKPISSG